MGRLGSTTSKRAREMRQELGRWKHSGLTLRKYGQERGIPVSTLSWWRRVFRHGGVEEGIAHRRITVWCSPKCHRR